MPSPLVGSTEEREKERERERERMGRRKKATKKIVKKEKKVVATKFTCPYCAHEKSVEVEMYVL